MPEDLGLRISLAAILGLVLVLGGRIAPALTATHAASRGLALPALRLRSIELVAGTAATIALGTWVLAPAAEATAVACTAAALAQAVRLAQWRMWRVLGYPSVLAVHVAYGWIPIGFGLLAAQIFRPGSIGRTAAVHAWAVGAIGLMSLAIMASMVRRQTRTAFMPSTTASLSVWCGMAAAAARVLAEVPGSDRMLWLSFATSGWIAAFILFLAAFRMDLLGWRPGIRQRPAHRRSTPGARRGMSPGASAQSECERVDAEQSDVSAQEKPGGEHRGDEASDR
ncbi:MAG: NnrS family protein [Candidatus Binatia bacterium]